MISGIDLDHVAVAVERQDDAWPMYAGDLGGEWLAGGDDPGFSSAQVRYANGMKLEVLQPFQPEVNDFLRRFLDRNGPGPHHLTYKVPDLAAALELVEDAGYRPVGVNLDYDEWKEAFLHPKDAPGVVVQLAQSSGGWESDQPASFPASRPSAPATLLHVAHAVAEPAEGLRLFRDLLGGEVVDEGEGWWQLAWPGPGRVRLLHGGPELDGRAGRVHHLAFQVEDPAAVAGATPVGDGTWDVAPPQNLGVRLRLHA